MGLLGLYMGKVTRVHKKLVGYSVFLKLVRPLVFDPACAENRVHSLLRQMGHLKRRTFLGNRVEHQKRNQTATSQWPVGFVFSVQLDYSCRLKSVSATAGKREVKFL